MDTRPFAYRLFWTWDSWICDPYSAASFVAEYQALIDWMAEYAFNGLIIWGFIDERHGGVEAAQAVARYGAARGVRILPGVGAGGYGGFVYSRGHRFNLETFLEAHPEARAHPRCAPDQPCNHALCLYHPDAQQWLGDGARWLAETFEIGGVNIETNEMDLIDVGPLAAAATAAEPNRLRYPASFSDLALATGIIAAAVQGVRDDAWITYATYWPVWWQRSEDAHLLHAIPSTAIAQWNTELQVVGGVPPPVERNISLIHAGGWSYHLAALPPRDAFTQYRCFLPELETLHRFIANQHAMGLDGFALGNVGAPSLPDHELNYLATAAFAQDPHLSVETFAGETIAELYGPHAQPLVTTLVLRQPEIQAQLKDLWQGWARLLAGQPLEGAVLRAATEQDLDGLGRQLTLARQARDVAHDAGRARLDEIIAVLTEYEAIAQLSLSDAAERCITGPADDTLADLARTAADLGLPDELYGYGRLLR